MKRIGFLLLILTIALSSLLLVRGSAGAPPDTQTAPAPKRLRLPVVSRNAKGMSIVLGSTNISNRLWIDTGGDVDTQAVAIAGVTARKTGNGTVVSSPDGNTVPDSFIQFRADDAIIFKGAPTTRARIEVVYYDNGTDTFVIEYDGVSGGPFDTGQFLSSAIIRKTNTRTWRTVSFLLCNAYFGNRDNGADFRISDFGDGAEIIRSVVVGLEPGGAATINVDAWGANPWDAAPDSDAIQAAIDSTCPGDVVTFTSGVGSAGYKGYTIDKTIFLVATSAKSNLTFRSTSTSNHALLKATAGLKGFVVRLFARSRVGNAGDIDNITISHLDLDGNRSARVCFGPDGVDNGVGDNWGSWLPECSNPGDSWCLPGGLGMDGGMDWSNQDYAAHLNNWSTGLLVDNVRISNVECGTGLAMGAAASTIRNTTIHTAGDHVHAPGCARTDNDEPNGAWSDGMTLTGPNHRITGNTVVNPSDIGIVFFGGRNTVISGNTIEVTTGNYGAFGGIAIHPWIFGDVSGVQIISNTVTSQGNTTCGNLHTGINIGTHMWGAGCVGSAHARAVGNAGSCTVEPAPPAGALCTEGAQCQEWAHVAAGQTLTLRGNHVAGAHINYLIEGLDLVGTLTQSNNTSGAPRLSDWEAAKNGCDEGGTPITWGALDKVAHHPSLAGWINKRIHCER